MYDFTKEQINTMVNLIQNMLDKSRESFMTLDEICDKDYLKGRKKYPIAAVVYSAFNVETQNMPGFTIQKIQYGRSRFMPEFYNDKAVIQMYSDKATPTSNKEVKQKIMACGPKFQIIEFTVDDNYELQKLSLISFDKLKGSSDQVRISARNDLFQS